MADPIRHAFVTVNGYKPLTADSGQPVGVRCDVGMGSHLPPPDGFSSRDCEEAPMVVAVGRFTGASMISNNDSKNLILSILILINHKC
jgi:hypothetical protein